MITEKVHCLSKVRFFADLNNQELSQLADDFKWREYQKDTVIIKQGQTEHNYYVLIAGKAEALVSKQGINSWKVSFFGPGDAFGEISLFTGKPAPTTVRCLENCRVLVLNHQNFTRMLVRWPKLYQKYLEHLYHNLHNANSEIWDAKYKDSVRSTFQLTHYKDKFYGVWGSARTTREVEGKIAELANTKENLFLIGERGTGRQVLAWYLHKRRFGESAAFLVIDGRYFDQQWSDMMYEAGEDDLAALFNLFGMVENGTLLFKEINRISPRVQFKLAECLKKFNCLVIASLQGNPEQLSPGIIPELRERFNQTYTIKPLRERKKDIPIIAQGILDKLARNHHKTSPVLTKEASKLLLSHHYRLGNVTELIRVMKRAFFLAENNLIGVEHIFFGPTAERIGRTVNLLLWPKIENIFKRGLFISWIRRFSAAVFLSIILLLILAPQIAMTNSIFILVWGLWWPVLAIISISFGRLWCTICPFAFIMELVQKKLHLNKPVPDWLQKYDYLFITFLFLFIFWIEVIFGLRTSPKNTVMLLSAFQLAAIIVGIIFTRHTWCRYLCPLGGFVGIASIGSILEIRADPTICLNKCTTNECYVGNGSVPGCPMFQHLPYLDNNLACKFCFNCVRNCPNGSVQLNLRIPGREVWHLVRVNQGFALFIGVILAILVPLNYLGPLQSTWPDSVWRLWFSIAYWGIAVGAGLITWLIAKPFKTKATSTRIKLVFAFIPLVTAGHIIYHLHFIPGVNSIFIGLGFNTPAGIDQAFYVSAFEIGAAVMFSIGLLMTIITFVMVILHAEGKLPEKSNTVKHGFGANIGEFLHKLKGFIWDILILKEN
ncbi:cyclic nucleotide-binding domain-containing protein [Desulfoscipio sp. XC116]|uniref:cyclic nucleotide-binding domain-containing protein n=1 Tax=Desulfoscipio sp. XC116 TaxID=3144975 RepID=UPI00325BD34C